MTHPFCTPSFAHSQVASALRCVSTPIELTPVVRTVLRPALCAGEPDSLWLDEWMSFCLAAEVQTSKVAFFSHIFIFSTVVVVHLKKKKLRKKKERIKARASFNLRIPPSSSSLSRLRVFACALMERELLVGRPHEAIVDAEYWSERLLRHPQTSLRKRGLFFRSRLKQKIPRLISDGLRDTFNCPCHGSCRAPPVGRAKIRLWPWIWRLHSVESCF